MRKITVLVVLAAILMSLAAVPALSQAVKNVELHGYMQNRLYFPPDGPTEFVTERVSLSASAQVGDTGTAYTEIYFHPWMPSVAPAEQYRTYLESAYVDLPLGQGHIRIGKGRSLNFGLTPTYGNRKTTQYGIVSETFTQDRIVGAQYALKKGAFEFGTNVYQDTRIGTRRIGDYDNATHTIPHFVDKDIPADASTQLAASAKIGWTLPCLSVHLSGATGKLMQADADAIGAAYGVATTDRNHNKYGVDAIWSKGPFVAQGEWYQGNFSFMKITGWQALVGYQPKDSRRFYLRYSALDNDQTPTANSLTWNTQQLTLGIVQPITKGVWAEFQYEKNMEDPASGSSNVDDDLLFVEFFTGF